MKNMNNFFLLLLFSSLGQSVYSQKYETAADTIRLNKEWLGLVSDTADLNHELLSLQENLKAYKLTADEKENEAIKSAEASSKQADKATNGELKPAKKAKKMADHAYEDRKEAEKAKDKMEKEEKKIKKLNKELTKKNERLVELDKMKTSINSFPKGLESGN